LSSSKKRPPFYFDLAELTTAKFSGEGLCEIHYSINHVIFITELHAFLQRCFPPSWQIGRTGGGVPIAGHEARPGRPSGRADQWGGGGLPPVPGRPGPQCSPRPLPWGPPHRGVCPAPLPTPDGLSSRPNPNLTRRHLTPISLWLKVLTNATGVMMPGTVLAPSSPIHSHQHPPKVIGFITPSNKPDPHRSKSDVSHTPEPRGKSRRGAIGGAPLEEAEKHSGSGWRGSHTVLFILKFAQSIAAARPAGRPSPRVLLCREGRGG